MDYYPLSASCVRSLTDKLYEKRKVAALEIEKLVKDYFSTNNITLLTKLLQVLDAFARSHDVNNRKGGLIGLAAFAIALGKDSSVYVHELVRPVLSCFHDSDSRVRYYACESLYNIVKVSRNSVLPYFGDIFDGLSKLASDYDQHVRSGFDLLDCLLKDIVSDSPAFDLPSFVPLLRERLYSKCQFARQFIVSWIVVLDENPEVDMIIYLSELLDGLFLILGDSSQEIRRMCESCLGEFLSNIPRSKEKVNLSTMINVLIVHSQSTHPLIQLTAFMWLKEFISCMNADILPHISVILSVTLPCLSYPEKSSIRENAYQVNSSLMNLISQQEREELDHEPSNKGRKNLMDQMNIAATLSVLLKQLEEGSVQTRTASIEWMSRLFQGIPDEMFRHLEKLLPHLLKTLPESSEDVAMLILKLITDVCTTSSCGIQPSSIPSNISFHSTQGLNKFFVLFLYKLITLFKEQNILPKSRASFIIKQLCIMLNSRDVFSCCSEILVVEEDILFASQMIEVLSFILLTSPELFRLRVELKNLDSEESRELFQCLYRSWCHSPVATVALCLLSQNYKHASQLLALIGDIEVTLQFLLEIDQLVQLIESPIFSYLRMQLLDPFKNIHLVRSLYSLLMLLPQSDAFYTLKHRLQCIPPPPPNSCQHEIVLSPSCDGNEEAINFAALLQHFLTVQEKHRHLIK